MTAEIDVPATVAGKYDVIKITFSVTEHVSLAYHENVVPVVREAMVEYASECDLSESAQRSSVVRRTTADAPHRSHSGRPEPSHRLADVVDQTRRTV